MSWLRLRSDGRGRQYDVMRGLLESALGVAYVGDWPAKLWDQFAVSRAVERTELTLPLLPSGARAMRVGFVSDIHLGPTTSKGTLDVAFARLAEARLDVLLLGGDYVFLDATPEKARLLATLVKRVPATRKIAVMGNHDLWTHETLIQEALESVGVQVLFNQSLRLDGELVIVGLDEPWTGTIDAEAAFRDIGDPATVLVLCHSPDGLPFAEQAISRLRRRPPALFVCGHTHGGHIATPWGAPVVPGRVGRKFPRGLHSVGAMQLYVSRGIGGAEVPMRAYARPEVVVFQLTPRT